MIYIVIKIVIFIDLMFTLNVMGNIKNNKKLRAVSELHSPKLPLN